MSAFHKIGLVILATIAWSMYEGHRDGVVRASVEADASKREYAAATKAKLDTQAEYAVERLRVLDGLRQFVEVAAKEEKARDVRQSAQLTKLANSIQAALKERQPCQQF